MADAMREKVGRKMFKQDHDEPWAQGEARTKLIYLNNAEAALGACRFEELVTALRVAWNALDSAEPVIEPGAPPEEIDHYILCTIAYASAISFVQDALAKVEASDA